MKDFHTPKSIFSRSPEFWDDFHKMGRIKYINAHEKIGAIIKDLNEDLFTDEKAKRHIQNKGQQLRKYAKRLERGHRQAWRGKHALLMLQLFKNSHWHLSKRNPLKNRTRISDDYDSPLI